MFTSLPAWPLLLVGVPVVGPSSVPRTLTHKFEYRRREGWSLPLTVASSDFGGPPVNVGSSTGPPPTDYFSDHSWPLGPFQDGVQPI
ncbi:unnamed protein product [Calypogeia fissa]